MNQQHKSSLHTIATDVITTDALTSEITSDFEDTEADTDSRHVKFLENIRAIEHPGTAQKLPNDGRLQIQQENPNLH